MSSVLSLTCATFPLSPTEAPKSPWVLQKSRDILGRGLPHVPTSVQTSYPAVTEPTRIDSIQATTSGNGSDAYEASVQPTQGNTSLISTITITSENGDGSSSNSNNPSPCASEVASDSVGSDQSSEASTSSPVNRVSFLDTTYPWATEENSSVTTDERSAAPADFGQHYSTSRYSEPSPSPSDLTTELNGRRRLKRTMSYVDSLAQTFPWASPGEASRLQADTSYKGAMDRREEIIGRNDRRSGPTVITLANIQSFLNP